MACLEAPPIPTKNIDPRHRPLRLSQQFVTGQNTSPLAQTSSSRTTYFYSSRAIHCLQGKYSQSDAVHANEKREKRFCLSVQPIEWMQNQHLKFISQLYTTTSGVHMCGSGTDGALWTQVGLSRFDLLTVNIAQHCNCSENTYPPGRARASISS